MKKEYNRKKIINGYAEIELNSYHEYVAIRSFCFVGNFLKKVTLEVITNKEEFEMDNKNIKTKILDIESPLISEGVEFLIHAFFEDPTTNQCK